MNTVKTHPYQVFHAKIWEMIIEYLEDFQDVQNQIKALPQLDTNKAVQRNKHLWMFGRVLPTIIPWNLTKWISEKDLLSCRLVCKRWSADVDTFLESLPQARAHHPRFQNFAEQQWRRLSINNDRESDDDSMDDSSDTENDDERSIVATPFGGTQLVHSDLMKTKPDGIRNIIANHPSGRSPFLGRSFSIVCPRQCPPLYRYRYASFREDSLKLHRKFGKHVWFYSLDFCWEMGRLSPTGLVPRYLSLLPNLRNLNINVYREGTLDSEDSDVDEFCKFSEELEKRMPPLPDLESLTIGRSLRFLKDFLILRFSAQLKQLELEISLWRPGYFAGFPKLEELQVTLVNPKCVEGLKGLLHCLQAPKLTWLKFCVPSSVAVTGGEEWSRSVFIFERDVFQWLKRFPNLEYLNFGDTFPVGQVKELRTLSPHLDSANSLKFISVRTSPGMDYNFLGCLPSLQHLQLFFGSELRHQEDEFAMVYTPALWKQHPKLRKITLHVEFSLGGGIQYSWVLNRDEYEYWRGSGRPLVDFPLRRRRNIRFPPNTNIQPISAAP